jgi:hypothetical protein
MELAPPVFDFLSEMPPALPPADAAGELASARVPSPGD